MSSGERTHLFHIAVETKKVEDVAAVHLGRMEAAHHGNWAGGPAAQEGGGSRGLRKEQRVGDLVLHLPTAPSVSAVSRQRQQGAVWACRDQDNTLRLEALKDCLSERMVTQLEDRQSVRQTDRQTDIQSV